MVCGNEWLSSLLQSFSYIGSFIGFIVMPFFADNFGRRQAERVSWVINIVGLIILGSSVNLPMVSIGSFLMGLGTNSTITLHYTFIKSLMVGKMRERSFLILQVMFSIGLSFVALSSMLIADWKVIVWALMLTPSRLIMPYSIWII
jgi:MFS family permease